MGGFFLLQGKHLFSEIFFNHMPFMAYISYAIQGITNPQTLYQLVLYHRLATMLWALTMDVLIIYRFRYAGLGFVFFYEMTKFYLFGDRFLAEGILVYLLVYMCGLVWKKFHQQNVYTWEYFFVAVASWFSIFMREPYIPLTLFLFFILFWGRKQLKIKILAGSLFVFLILLTLIILPFDELIFNVYTVNKELIKFEQAEQGIGGIGMLKSFVYPFVVFVTGKWNFFHGIEVLWSLLFLVLFGIYIATSKRFLFASFLFIILGLAGIRYISPGNIYYGSFHMLMWYACFIFFTFSLLQHVIKKRQNIHIFASIILICITGIALFSHESVFQTKRDRQEEFSTNYALYYAIGNVVQTLAKPSDTLFLDGADDMIYWQAKRTSSYRYGWYTSLMPGVKKYYQAKTDLFKKSPPDFYYDSCIPHKTKKALLSPSIKKQYREILFDGKSACLYIKRAIVSQISKASWEAIKKQGYTLADY